MPQAMLLDDLQAFFTAYAQAIREGDPGAILRFFAMPLTRAATARQTLLEDEEAAEDAVDALRARLEANGIANARLATIELGQVGEDTADVNVHWELLDEDDAPVIAYDVGYSLTRTGAHDWRIAEIREDEQNRAFADAGWTDRDAA